MSRLYAWWSDRLDHIRLRVARPEAILHLALLGLLTGLLAGGLIVLFRLLVEGAQSQMLPAGPAENYAGLDPAWRAALPLAGGVLLAVMFRYFSRGEHVLGVARVLERMAYHQGHIGWRGALLQFFGAAVAIASGHSVGREGPNIFLGAAAGSLLGQRLTLPNNVIRTLVGCGTAAGIAASFNTPLAGVVFALEVVMLEYSVASFIPVILAAVGATTLSNAVFGAAPAFTVPRFEIASLAELWLVVFLGIAAGIVSAGFNTLVERTAGAAARVAIWWRMIAAGALVALVGWWLPQIMGVGYASVQAALYGSIAPALLFALVVGKLIASGVSIGLGVPGGTIGPVLFIGAMVGGLVAELGAQLPFDIATAPGFFVLLGMGALMSGSLNAPLAALTAMLELTDNPDIILPGMLAVVVAGVTASEGFGKRSLFVSLLRANGLDYDANPVLQALRRVGVAGVMDANFQRCNRHLDTDAARQLVAAGPAWLIINDDDLPRALMPAVDLAKFLGARETGGETDDEAGGEETPIDMLAIPAQRQQLAPVHLSENLQQALERLDRNEGEALYVERVTAPGIRRIYGILTRGMIDTAYRPG